MKSRIVAALGISLAVLNITLARVTHSVAQEPAKPGNREAKRETPLAAGLKAITPTGTQDSQIKDVQKKYRGERKEMLQAAQGGMAATPGERRTKIAEIEAKELADIKAILTAEQAPVFQAAYDAAKRQRGGTIIDQAIEKLDLTDEQKTKIAPLVKDAADAMLALRNDAAAGGREKAVKMRTIWDDTKAKIRPLLTVEQQSTLDAMKAFRGAGKRAGVKRGEKP